VSSGDVLLALAQVPRRPSSGTGDIPEHPPHVTARGGHSAI
jgi:hypothetical protein